MSARVHQMPFGAHIQADGQVRFRLWAPSAREVLLQLPQRHQELPMSALDGGWFELTTPAAGADALYQFRIDGGLSVPDPASRSNPSDVHGPSKVVDPARFQWRDTDWEGRPWHQAVVYELHVGTFSGEGTFAGAERHLDHLQSLGVTAIELMPVADFPGKRNWGYDGVLPFAPDATYGTPEDLKHLVVAAHARGLMVLLDVVYNHFGPDGNYLHTYARSFFTDRHRTPWGEAINFDGKQSRTVRDFFIHNALYWLEEYHLDGLRFDAVHAVQDDSTPDIFTEISQQVRRRFGRERQIHLVLENVRNDAHRLSKAPADPGRFEAQWNDDVHHCLHTLLTGESDGYYQDFTGPNAAHGPHRLLGRCLAEGFAYQGELSRYRQGRARGEPSAGLPPTCFVSFLQNHDQIGNRARGDRLVDSADPRSLAAAIAVVLLAPQPPMLFMGEEWGARAPFPFFCDFGPELAQAVRAGRIREFSKFERFKGEAAQGRIPDPGDPATFAAAKLDWSLIAQMEHTEWLDYYRKLLAVRHAEIVPRLPGMRSGRFELHEENLLTVHWPAQGRATLTLLANLTPNDQALTSGPAGRILHSTHPVSPNHIPAWGVVWSLLETI